MLRIKLIQDSNCTTNALDLRGIIGGLGIPFAIAVTFLSGIRYLKGELTAEAVAAVTLVVLLYLFACIAEDFPRGAVWTLVATASVSLTAGVAGFVLVYSFDGPITALWITGLFAVYSGVVVWAAVHHLRRLRV
jgi:hypothetical protein